MSEHFGVALKRLRQGAGLTLADVAGRTSYSPSLIARVENGTRRPRIELANELDQLFGSWPLLTMYAQDGSDDVRRRSMLGMVAVALGAGVGGTTGASGGLASVVRLGWEHDLSGNLDETVALYRRAYHVDKGPTFGDALLADMQVVREMAREKSSPELLRAGAHLALLYGLWVGDMGGDPVAAYGWYTHAASMARDSGDAETLGYVRGRTGARGVYEGLSVSEANATIEHALRLAPDGEGAMEAYAARVHLAGVTGDLEAGRRAADAMARVAARLPEPDHAATPMARAALFRNYVICRLGTMAEADQAYADAAPLLAGVPAWWTDATIYHCLAMAANGWPDAGIRKALDALGARPTDSRIFRLGVRDLVSAVPAEYRGAELVELTRHASIDPGPWETLRP